MQARPGMGGQPRWRCVMRRRRQHGVPVIGALVLLALLAVIAAAIRSPSTWPCSPSSQRWPPGPSTWASCTSEGAHDRVRSSRARPGQRSPQPPRHCQRPRCRWLATVRTRRWLTSGRTGTRCSLTRYPALTRSGGRHKPARLHENEYLAAGAGLTTCGLRSGLLLAAMLFKQACLRRRVDRGSGGCDQRHRPAAATHHRHQPHRRQHQKSQCRRLIPPSIAITPEPRPSLLHRISGRYLRSHCLGDESHG